MHYINVETALSYRLCSSIFTLYLSITSSLSLPSHLIPIILPFPNHPLYQHPSKRQCYANLPTQHHRKPPHIPVYKNIKPPLYRVRRNPFDSNEIFSILLQDPRSLTIVVAGGLALSLESLASASKSGWRFRSGNKHSLLSDAYTISGRKDQQKYSYVL